MKFLKSLLPLCGLCALALTPGCMTNSDGTVNQANLTLDCSALVGLSSTGFTIALQKDPSLLQPFKDAKTALDGALNGANTNSVSQALAAFNLQNNPTITAEVTPLIQSASSLEQQLVTKYGATTGGQIALAVASAVDKGLTFAVAGK